MKKKLIPAAVLSAFLIISLGIIWFLHANYLLLDGTVYSRSIQTLDLSGTTVTEPEKLAELTDLRVLDLRDTGITTEQYNLLRTALPACEIQWSVPFQGSFYPQDTQLLTLTTLSEADISQLAYLPQLHTVDATDCKDYDALMELRAAYPDCEIAYRVDVGNQQLPQDATKLILGSGTVEDLANALAYLPELKRVEAFGCQDYAALHALQQQYPDCSIRYTVVLGGVEWGNDSAGIVLKDPDIQQLEAALPYLPRLTSVRLEGTLPTNEEIHALQLAFPDINFLWSFPLCGITVNSNSTEIDLSNVPMESVTEVESALKYFNHLSRVIMCDCGISNEDMDALGQRNPDIRFVWTVSIGRRIRLRTDATYLMPYQYGTILKDADLENLKYCIDLMCVDFGHMDISDVSFLAYTPHMKYLVLGDTDVADISACAGLKELVYLELFLTNVTDYSPLVGCESLEDLNICYSLPSDVTPLCRMTQLKNLWIKGYWDPEGRAQLLQSLPNTRIVFTTADDVSSTAHGWRELPNYYAMRDTLGMFYMTG